jgi:hypothetical protein
MSETGHVHLTDVQGGVGVAFEKLRGKSASSVLYVPGYGSGMEGNKALHLRKYLQESDCSFIREMCR